MVRAATKVYVRTRPCDKVAEGITFAQDGKTMIIAPSRKNQKIGASSSQAAHSFSFDGVLHNTPQEEVYETAVHDFVATGLSGVNGTLLAYGQTGAGKTYSMVGGTAYATRGIIPRALAQIYTYQKDRPDLALDIQVSFLEIYNEQLVDLLVEEPSPDTLVIHDTPQGSVAVRGLTTRLCSTEAEALASLFEGLPRRRVSTHALNLSSSRSHAIFTVHVYARSRVESNGRAVTSKIHFVDLAGSERVGRSGGDKQQLSESRHINQSLTYLEQVVVALGNPGRDHVPFRSSRLTSLLRDSLGGNGRTVLLASVWPGDDFMEETSSSLRFAARMARVECEYIVNVAVDPELQVRALQRQVSELRAELALYQNRGARVGATTPTPAEVLEALPTAESYVTGTTPDIEFNTMRNAVAVARCLRELCLKARQQAAIAEAGRGLDGGDGGKKEGGAAGGAGGRGGAGGACATSANGAQGAPVVGSLQSTSGFGVGSANAAARSIPAVAAPSDLFGGKGGGKDTASGGGVNGGAGGSPIGSASGGGRSANGQRTGSRGGRGGTSATGGSSRNVPGLPPVGANGFATTQGGGDGGGSADAAHGGAAPPPYGTSGGSGDASYEDWSRGPGRVTFEQLRSTQRLLDHAKEREKISREATTRAKASVAAAQSRLEEAALAVELSLASTGAADAVAVNEREANMHALASTQQTLQLNKDALAAAVNERSQLEVALQELRSEAQAAHAAWRKTIFASGYDDNGNHVGPAAGGAGAEGGVGEGGGRGGSGGDGGMREGGMSHLAAYQEALKMTQSP